METQEKSVPQTKTPIIDRQQLLAHWQGHRSLTRRVIGLFPDDKLFSFRIGGMRPFGAIIQELLAIAGPGVVGLATNEWNNLDENLAGLDTKEKLLSAWDETTERINEWWPRVPEERFQERITAFGQYEDVGYCTLLYFIDNEIHHRGQGYVYLRYLGVAPPNFWER
ncbi:hypothetical protein ADIS_1534 [Lunatimonas lonarensis]|uniref:DinB family protein n=1 Tax=Lunatimonas lonarensis TaxID=1232681 RepID=R7ZV32_9BACT|nr:DinB family protein [Lunatimonas lonarensis]EON77995.1 hypothetical protein ADIS_1534 [Lunatimonas lonarensis]